MADTQVQKREAKVPVEVEHTREVPVFVPRVDIYETKDATVLVADMPGVGSNDVEIELEENILAIRGRVKTGKREGYDLVYSEYVEGEYERLFSLSDGVDRNKIEASMKNGVLRLVLPKAEELKPKKIEVKTA